MPAMTPSIRRLTISAASGAAVLAVALGTAPAQAVTIPPTGTKIFVSAKDNGHGKALIEVRNGETIPIWGAAGLNRIDKSVAMNFNTSVPAGGTRTMTQDLAAGAYKLGAYFSGKSGGRKIQFNASNSATYFTMKSTKSAPKQAAPKQDGPKKLGPNTKLPQGKCTYCNPKPGNPPKEPAPKGPFGIDFGSLKLG